jgi:16S rRNA (uracil1498-N3)-methyltransferase
MNQPFFYHEELSPDLNTLDEDTSKYLITVLRKKVGDEVVLTEGRGTKAFGAIVDDNRKKAVVKISSITKEEKRKPSISIAISPVKNSSRFEWFLEKATEIGVTEIIPAIYMRTEKQNIKWDRMKSILVSAMLQSQQTWLPGLQQPKTFQEIMQLRTYEQKFIAHCLDTEKSNFATLVNNSQSSLILIGPEGDFTPGEVKIALQEQFQPVSLGDTRLRTETAGMVAAVLMRLSKNQ